MNRIDISYGGQWYSIGNRTLDEVHQEIQEGVAAGQHWLAVNDGEGSPRPAYLFITPGVPIAVIPVPEPQDPPTDGQAEPEHPAPSFTTTAADDAKTASPSATASAPAEAAPASQTTDANGAWGLGLGIVGAVLGAAALALVLAGRRRATK